LVPPKPKQLARAARTGRRLQIEYTLPVEPPGLESEGLHVLRNAIRNGTRVDVVNIMTFDYYDDQAHEMATDTRTAANGLLGTAAALSKLGRHDEAHALFNRVVALVRRHRDAARVATVQQETRAIASGADSLDACRRRGAQRRVGRAPGRRRESCAA